MHPESDMRAQGEGTLLVIDADHSDTAIACQVLSRSFPRFGIAACHDLAQARVLLQQMTPDAVVLNIAPDSGPALEFTQELRLLDEEPALVALVSDSSPEVVGSVLLAGVHKCILKHARWTEELGPAVRQVVRVRRLEEENRRLMAKLTESNQMLEEKNRRLDEFSATVAHDIRGPLAGISMKLDYMIDTYEKGIDERFAQLLRRALSAADRLTEVVQVMYDLAKLGAKAAQMQKVALDQLVEQVVQDLDFDKQYDGKLEVVIGVGNLPQVWGSPELLRRVFINLLSNAVKYSDKKQVIINVGLDRVEERSLAPFCHFYVEDNGPGIPSDELRDIFTMFRRGSHCGKAPDGSGVGLAVVQRIVELHYGSVQVSSSPQRGTRFTLALPMEKVM
jgi:signal transduction histidine kinase